MLVANLLESGVRFVAIDMPNADRFMLHVYAAIAEEEGRRISERTKAALAAAKARGTKLGENGKKLALQNKKEAEVFAKSVELPLRQMIVQQQLTFRAAADRLNELNVPTARGGQWHPSTVFRAWQRLGI